MEKKRNNKQIHCTNGVVALSNIFKCSTIVVLPGLLKMRVVTSISISLRSYFVIIVCGGQSAPNPNTLTYIVIITNNFAGTAIQFHCCLVWKSQTNTFNIQHSARTGDKHTHTHTSKSNSDTFTHSAIRVYICKLFYLQHLCRIQCKLWPTSAMTFSLDYSTRHRHVKRMRVRHTPKQYTLIHSRAQTFRHSF